MEAPKAPQFTAYDFLGYVVPGLCCAALIDLSVQYHHFGTRLDYNAIVARYGGFTWPALVPLFLVAYFLGHIISFASSLSVERHAGWMHGLPAKRLLYSYNPKYLHTGGRSPAFSVILRLFVFIILLPITIFEVPLTKWVKITDNYIRPADQLIRDAFKFSMVKIMASLGIRGKTFSGCDPWDYEVERLAIHCAIERAPMHLHTLRNYVVLYGFLRSMCLLLVMVFWAVVGHLFYSGFFPLIPWALLMIGGFAFVCYAAFLKFWFRYYHEGIMALIAINAFEKEGRNSSSSGGVREQKAHRSSR